MHIAVRYVSVLVLLCASRFTKSKADNELGGTTAVDRSASASTCPFEVVNYITFSPHHCLDSGWRSTHLSTSVDCTPAPAPLSSSPSTTQPEATRTQHAVKRLGSGSVESSASTIDTLSNAPSPTDSSSVAVHVSPAEPSVTPTHTFATSVQTDEEEESPLDTAQFLSFEDWKKQNLARAGQSADNVGQARGPPRNTDGRRRSEGINDALDSLGEDTEIELNFDGFGSLGPTREGILTSERGRHQSQIAGTATPNVESAAGHGQARPRARRKDAGKTCKERFNYASFDCAANVLKTNPKCRSSSSVLVENKDSYMLNVCSEQNKFLIVELCDDILIDTVVLANFEYFSSMFRTFRGSVSDRYPVRFDRWKELGVFEARNNREVQAFLIENPLIWARYLRVEFLTYYGNEYYCPVSLLRVHGTTMMEEYRHEEDASRGEEEEDDDDEESTVESKAREMILADDNVGSKELKEAHSVGHHLVAPPLARPSTSTETTTTVTITVREASTSEPTSEAHVEVAIPPTAAHKSMEGMCLLSEEERVLFTRPNLSASVCATTQTAPESSASSDMPHVDESHQKLAYSEEVRLSASVVQSDVISDLSIEPTPTSLPSSPADTTGEPTIIVWFSSSPTLPSQATPDNRIDEAATKPTLTEKMNSKDSSSASPCTESTKLAAPALVSKNSTDQPLPELQPTPSKNAARSVSGSTQPAAPSPTTQESFFKSIHKRLSLLESNASLSLQYIESQSLLLRNAFSAVSKQQSSKTERFLDTLNRTVSAELAEFRRAYDHLWHSTALELEQQKDRLEKEMELVGKRVGEVVEEIVWLERVIVVQGLLVVICLGLLVFSKIEGLGMGRTANYPDASIVTPNGHWSPKSSSGSPPNSPPRPGTASSLESMRKRFWTRSSSPATEVQSEDDSKASQRSRSPELSTRTSETVSDAEAVEESPTTPQQRSSTYLTPSHNETPEHEHDEMAVSGELRTIRSSPPTPTARSTGINWSSPPTPTGWSTGINWSGGNLGNQTDGSVDTPIVAKHG